MLNLDVHGEALGYELKLMSEAFDQNAAVALDLFRPLVHLPADLFELPVDAFESAVDLLESVINAFEAPINLSESLVDPLLQRLESGIEVLKEFLIHGASASGRVCRSG